MRSSNEQEIQRAFTQQAQNFESGRMQFSNREYLGYMVSKIAPDFTDSVLEVAAGTCACGRAIAPHVRNVVCLDMTSEMLAVGKAQAEREELTNMTFVSGDSVELPFPENSFDIVLSRLAFHHFPDASQPFSEMARVLKPGGKLVMIDMEAAEEPLRKTEDEIEKLRDPSHIRNLSRREMLDLFTAQGMIVSCCEVSEIPINLQNWLDHAAAPENIQSLIVSKMKNELSGGERTGFYPYLKDDNIEFKHRWVLIIGNKK